MIGTTIQTVQAFKGKKIAVLGLGRSGRSAAVALQQGGAEVMAWDDGHRPSSADYPIVDLNSVEWRDVAALVISPGIPTKYPEPNPIAAAARAAGVPLICDVELLLLANSEATFIGITGTNGKSTCTALTHHLIKASGRPTAMGGNIGIPALAMPQLGADGIYVLELSSYQLELMQTPRLKAALLLNITPDHLDRHGGLDGYVAAKKLIFDQLLEPQGEALVAMDDAICRSVATSLGACRPVSGYSFLPKGYSAPRGLLLEDGDAVLDLEDCLTLPGQHNAQNITGAYGLCRAAGLLANEIIPHFKTFPGLEHRQERVLVKHNLQVINDSKATNAEATAPALKAYTNILWIMGGLAKDAGIKPLLNHMEPVVEAFIIGTETSEFQAQLDGILPNTVSGTVQQAVQDAFARALQQPDTPFTILLSPACASFDQFPSFVARGDAFKQAVTDFIGA